MLNTPNNPVGHGYDPQRLDAIAQVARARGLIVVSDEIYGALHHEGAHASIARAYPEGTLVTSGLCKWCGAGGWRLGTLLVPPPLHALRDALAVLASETYTSVSAPVQHAAVTAYTAHPEIDDYLRRSRAIVGALGRWASARLRGVGCRCPTPEGAFYLLADLSPALAAPPPDAAELCERLIDEAQVATLPGGHFGLPRRAPIVRLALVDFDGAAALRAAGDAPVDEAFLRRRCAPVVEGIERLAAWIARS